jgi:hypothetical protein
VSTLDGGAADLVEPGGIASVGASDLYQLTVDGDASKIIRSENAPSGKVVTSSTALPAQAAPATSMAPIASAFTGPATEPVMIGAAIPENPQSLGAVTDWLVEGDVAIEIAAAGVNDTRAPDARLDAKDSATPGSSTAAHGEVDQTPGKSGEAPGQVKDTPGKSGEAPGSSGSGSSASGSGGAGAGDGGSAPTADDAAEKAAKEAEKAAEKAAEEAAKAADEAQKAADKAAADAEKAAQKAADDAAKAADEAAKAAEKAAKDAAKAVDGLCVAGAVCVGIL